MQWIINNGINNTIKIDSSVQRLGNLKIIVNGNNNSVNIGRNTRLHSGVIEIRKNNSRFAIGNNCRINGSFIMISDDTTIDIGSKTTMMNVFVTLHEKGSIHFGEDCMLSSDIRMDVSDMHSIIDFESGRRINPPKNISIGNHVWIGYGVQLMKGCIIGDNSIIGAKALVNSIIPNNCIAVGTPARVVKDNINWDRRLLPIE